jgi:hypothetical protein
LGEKNQGARLHPLSVLIHLHQKAASVVSIDTPASKKILSAIQKLPNVISVKQIHLPV